MQDFEELHNDSWEPCWERVVRKALMEHNGAQGRVCQDTASQVSGWLPSKRPKRQKPKEFHLWPGIGPALARLWAKPKGKT